MCGSPSPLNVNSTSSKGELLGSVHGTPGVAGCWTPAGWWVLRAGACLDQGLNFPLKMRKRFMARSHESVSCSLKLLSWWLLLSLGRDYFISSCFFLFVPLPFLALQKLKSGPKTSVEIISLPFPFLSTLFQFLLYRLATATPSLLLVSQLHHTLFFFPPYISCILPFQYMTDCVINEYHKPLFLLATH